MTSRASLKLSPSARLFERDGAAALFHTLRLTKVYGDGRLKDAFHFFSVPRTVQEAEKRFPAGLIAALLSAHMLSRGEEGNGRLLNKIQSGIGKFAITNLVLLVSNNCNFRCSYCQIEENMGIDSMVDMSLATAGKALDLFGKNSSGPAKKTVTITGGEPLLNLGAVKFIISKVRKDLKNARLVVFTNGSLVTAELARYFKDNNVLMLVSLDGPEKMHNAARKTRGGGGSFARAVAGYRILREAGCEVGISVVGGTHNIRGLSKLFPFLTELSPASIGFNFSHFLLQKDNPTAVSALEFGKALTALYAVLREKGIFLENISRSVGSFAGNIPRTAECQAQGRGFTVDARGKLGPCKSLVVSDIFSREITGTGKIKDDAMFKDWAGRSPFMAAACRDCQALAICGGGCAYDSYIINKGDFKGLDPRVCEYKKYLLEYLIWDLFGRIKGKIARRGFYAPSVKEQRAAFGIDRPAGGLRRSVGH